MAVGLGYFIRRSSGNPWKRGPTKKEGVRQNASSMNTPNHMTIHQIFR
ncbi:hypothetical protein SAMN06265784_102557 [Paraburkholderia susongensis]|uniref:Uncharacterized protein n=1 Tax=Paraburkholderia susongensis TaxID=1515439 RepID=A0A1X7JFT5_9BURK|nr:hypothetical protein SAMN06265784_102557 [Paraburkholderia susongensis]